MSNFIDFKQFPYLQIFKDNFSLIKKEYDAAVSVSKKVAWNKCMSYENFRYKIHDGHWSVVALFDDGKPLDGFKDNYPALYNIVTNLSHPIKRMGFSIMLPGTEIREHNGMNLDNTVIRCHLCLYTNSDCALIVNGEKRGWEQGNFLLFCDDDNHSAYNRGDSERVVLLFDIIKTEYKTKYDRFKRLIEVHKKVTPLKQNYIPE
jgi:aspartyl/asparaginyl beta-hydroxylase (cupin superfamily)